MEKCTLINADCLNALKELPNESIDLVLTDVPYGISFMSKNWDSLKQDFYYKTATSLLPKMKTGSFFVTTMTSRQDMLWRLYADLEKARFNINFSSCYWLYHSGFPKACDVSKQ